MRPAGLWKSAVEFARCDNLKPDRVTPLLNLQSNPMKKWRCLGASLIAGWAAGNCPPGLRWHPSIVLPRQALQSRLQSKLPLLENLSKYPKSKSSLLSSRTAPLRTLVGE